MEMNFSFRKLEMGKRRTTLLMMTCDDVSLEMTNNNSSATATA
jgi:hypothetical protein